LPSCDDPKNGFTLGFTTLYLRDSPPEPLRKGIALSALTALAQGDQGIRAEGLADAYQRIQELAGDDASALLEAADVLATIRLDANIIEQIREENGMTVETIADFYSHTKFGQELRHRGHAEMLEDLIQDRFGDQPETAGIAGRLAQSGDRRAAIRSITHAATFDDLLRSLRL